VGGDGVWARWLGGYLREGGRGEGDIGAGGGGGGVQGVKGAGDVGVWSR